MKASFMILPMLLLSAKAALSRTVEARPEARTRLAWPERWLVWVYTSL